MKKQITLFAVCSLLILAVAYTAFAQGKGKDKDKKEQKDKGNKGQDKQEKEKGDKKDDKNENGKKNDNKNEGKDEKDHGNGNNGNKGNYDASDGYHWNHETFKDRDKLKNQEKVTLCHKTGNNEPGVTLHVSRNALKAHLGHGDVTGECPAVANSHYSNTFLDRRNEYYNTLQTTQEQVLYSRSILDYALERLTNARLQLVTMQTSNMPVAQIQNKQVVVTELEQNVSLLQSLIGVAVNLLVNKLQ
jgi:hypothetical protein